MKHPVHVNICVMADKCELEVLIDNHENNKIVIAHYSSFVCVNSAISWITIIHFTLPSAMWPFIGTMTILLYVMIFVCHVGHEEKIVDTPFVCNCVLIPFPSLDIDIWPGSKPYKYIAQWVL